MIKKQLTAEVYTSPRCRVINVDVATVLCGSPNGAPDIDYDPDPFSLS